MPAMPHRRELLAIFVAAILLRLLALGAMGYERYRADEPRAFADLPFISDGAAYNGTAQRINGDGMPIEYDRRVFVGLPWVIAMIERPLAHLGVDRVVAYGATSQTICLLFSGLMCVAGARWLKDARVGWALAMLPPHFVLDTSAVMNESLMLLLCILALWACAQRSWGMLMITAVCFGFAGMVRPMACFATAGALAMLWQAGRRRDAMIVAGATLVVFGGLLLAFTKTYWNPIDNVAIYRDHPSAYGGEMFAWPFKSFVHAIAERGLFSKTVIYKSIYIVAAIAISVAAIVRWRGTKEPLDAMAATWLTLNTLFATCIGSHWGIDIAQRSTAWAIPAAFYVLHDRLPTKWYWRLAWAVLPMPLVFVTSQG